MFRLEDYEILMDWFTDFATEKAKLRPSSLSRYKVILNDYFKNFVVGKVSKEDYVEMFHGNRLSLLKRKSNNVRPSFIHFLYFLNHEGFIEDEYLYFQLQNNIKSIFVTEEPERETAVTFLTPNEVRFMFSGKVTFRNEYEEKLLCLLCSLTFFNMFKQEDIIKLSIKDVDIDNKKIRNIRISDTDSELLEWLPLNDTTLLYLQMYLPFRNTQQGNDALLIMENAPLDNTKINNLFRTFEFTSNRNLVGNQRVYSGLLIRTMMLYILTSTKGQGVYQILLEQERNAYFEDAFNEYLSIRRNNSDFEISQDFDLKDVLPVKRTKPREIGAYSEENDIDEGDLKEFDSYNERNLEMKNVSIQRLVRDSKVSRQLKNLYQNQCQLCGFKLRKANGEYLSEGHHIQPYNPQHRGDDNTHNIIILCPNCHAQFDDLYYSIHPDTEEVHCIFGDEDEYHLSKLIMKEGHILHKRYLDYTWVLFEEKKHGSSIEAFITLD